MSDLIPPDKLELLLNAIRPGMPHGVTLEATCRGDWLDLHLSYEGARLSRVKAFCMREIWLVANSRDSKEAAIRVLEKLQHVARGVAKKLIHQRGIEFRFEELWAGRHCVHFGAGGYICDFCGLWVPRLS